MLTRQQKKLLDLMRDYNDRNGVMPSREEMAELMGTSSLSNIHRMVKSLEERGAIRRIPNRARAIQIIDGFPV